MTMMIVNMMMMMIIDDNFSECDDDDIAERKMSVSHLFAQYRRVITVKAPIGETSLLLLGEQCLCCTDVGSCFITTNMLFSY